MVFHMVQQQSQAQHHQTKLRRVDSTTPKMEASETTNSKTWNSTENLLPTYNQHSIKVGSQYQCPQLISD